MMPPRTLAMAFSALIGAMASVKVQAATTQFHLSVVGPSDDGSGVNYMLDWVADGSATASSIKYGTTADLDGAEVVSGRSLGAVEQSAGASVTCWTALLPRLSPGSTVYYALAPNSTTAGLSFDTLDTQVFNATVPEGEITWAVFGDMGAPVQGHASAVSLPALKEELASGKYTGVLNIGDLSYELTTSNGENYMDELLDITSQVPMMTTVGNHEYQYGLSPDLAVQNYLRRFYGITSGAGAVSGSASPEFYSFTSGRIHFVFINTEVYGDEAFVAPQADGTWAVDNDARLATGTAQAEWLEYDLSRVDRSVTPYVVVCGHRPPFKTPDGLSATGNRFVTEILPLLSEYDVDLYLAGHEHTYIVFEASTFGGYNVPPIIISGSPGNNEYIREEAELEIVDFTWKTLIPKYGFGYLTATDEELKWQWGSAATDATHEPKSASWTLQDEISFARKSFSGTYDKQGSAVDEPVDVENQWATSSASRSTSGGQTGSQGSLEATVSAEDSSQGAGSSSSDSSGTPLLVASPVMATMLVTMVMIFA